MFPMNFQVLTKWLYYIALSSLDSVISNYYLLKLTRKMSSISGLSATKDEKERMIKSDDDPPSRLVTVPSTQQEQVSGLYS